MTPARIRLSVGHHLRTWQQARGYTQSDMAQMLGIGQSYYSKLAFGVGKFNLDILCQIAKTTGIPVHELILPPEEPVELSHRWRTSDLVARLDNCKAIAIALERQGNP